MNLVLVGFMASGKSSIGRRVARRLGFRFTDTDHFIEDEAGTTIPEIFEHEGEAGFRRRESRLLERLHRLDGYVFATGGGIVTPPGNVERLRRLGLVIFLKADPEDILRRLEHDTRRPLMADADDRRERVMRLLAERLPLYEQAHIVIETRGKTPNQVAGEVIRRVSAWRGASEPAPSSGEPAAAAPPPEGPAS